MESSISETDLKVKSTLDLNYEVFVSSNTSGMISAYNISEEASNPMKRNFKVPYADADEITDEVTLTPTAMVPLIFSNGREASIYNNKVGVADDVEVGGRLASYHVNDRQITDFREYTADF